MPPSVRLEFEEKTNDVVMELINAGLKLELSTPKDKDVIRERLAVAAARKFFALGEKYIKPSFPASSSKKVKELSKEIFSDPIAVERLTSTGPEKIDQTNIYKKKITSYRRRTKETVRPRVIGSLFNLFDLFQSLSLRDIFSPVIKFHVVKTSESDDNN